MEASLDDEELEEEFSEEAEMSKREQEKYFSNLYSKRSRRSDYFERLQKEDPESLAQLYEDSEVPFCLILGIGRRV